MSGQFVVMNPQYVEHIPGLRLLLPVVGHVAPHKVASCAVPKQNEIHLDVTVCSALARTGEGRHEGKLASHHSSADGLGKLTGVRAGRSEVRALHPHDVEAGRLRTEVSSATDGADLNGGHRAGDVKVLAVRSAVEQTISSASWSGE